MAKIIAIGDIHGRTKWKEIVEKEPADTIVFIGDYFDTFANISPEKQLENFEDILRFRNTHTERVILLIGNHDFHYLSMAQGEHYSGYNPMAEALYAPVLGEAVQRGILQVAFQAEGVLYSHAGLTKTWAMRNNVPIDVPEVYADMVNHAFWNNPSGFKFYQRDSSGCGEHPAQSPIWVRPDSLVSDRVPGVTQVVGHTGVRSMGFADAEKSVVLIDCLGTSGEYLEVSKGQFIVHSPNLIP